LEGLGDTDERTVNVGQDSPVGAEGSLQRLSQRLSQRSSGMFQHEDSSVVKRIQAFTNLVVQVDHQALANYDIGARELAMENIDKGRRMFARMGIFYSIPAVKVRLPLCSPVVTSSEELLPHTLPRLRG
jgi:hypothetical protein